MVAQKKLGGGGERANNTGALSIALRQKGRPFKRVKRKGLPCMTEKIGSKTVARYGGKKKKKV